MKYEYVMHSSDRPHYKGFVLTCFPADHLHLQGNMRSFIVDQKLMKWENREINLIHVLMQTCLPGSFQLNTFCFTFLLFVASPNIAYDKMNLNQLEMVDILSPRLLFSLHFYKII